MDENNDKSKVREGTKGRTKKRRWPSAKELANTQKAWKPEKLNKTSYHVGTFTPLNRADRTGERHIIEILTGKPICNCFAKYKNTKRVFNYYSFDIKDATCRSCRCCFRESGLKPWQKRKNPVGRKS